MTDHLTILQHQNPPTDVSERQKFFNKIIFTLQIREMFGRACLARYKRSL